MIGFRVESLDSVGSHDTDGPRQGTVVILGTTKNRPVKTRPVNDYIHRAEPELISLPTASNDADL